jgi:hypothetical protein
MHSYTALSWKWCPSCFFSYWVTAYSYIDTWITPFVIAQRLLYRTGILSDTRAPIPLTSAHACAHRLNLSPHSHHYLESTKPVDMAHTVSINGIFTSNNIPMKLTKILQFRHISHNYSNLRHSTTGILMWTILTSAQNYHGIKNKHRWIQADLTQFLYFHLFHHNLAHNLARCLVHRLSIVGYCFRFAPLLHSCITYCFFICDAP